MVSRVLLRKTAMELFTVLWYNGWQVLRLFMLKKVANRLLWFAVLAKMHFISSLSFAGLFCV